MSGRTGRVGAVSCGDVGRRRDHARSEQLLSSGFSDAGEEAVQVGLLVRVRLDVAAAAVRIRLDVGIRLTGAVGIRLDVWIRFDEGGRM